MNRLVLFVLVALLIPSRVLAQATPDAAPLPSPLATTSDAVVTATLNNGMKVILLPNKLAPVATTLMVYGVGSNDDSMPGIAHATEHMLFRGTKDVSAGQFADIAARMGAVYNAQTSFEYTLYYFKLPSGYTDIALRLEADRMNNALIRESDWATERGAIEQEVRARQSQPGYAIGTKLRESFFRGTPLANDGVGTIPSFQKMTAADIHTFYQSWYHPGNATLIVAGDIEPKELLAKIHTMFDPIPAAVLPPRQPMTVPPLADATIQDTMDFPLGFTALGYRFPGSTAHDYAASQVLNQVFLSGRGALSDLTADGKTLGVVAFTNAFPELGVSFLVAIPAQGSTPLAARALVTGVLDQYRKDGLPNDLIAAARTRLLADRAYGEASISGLGFAWADAVTQRRASPDAIYDELVQVGPSDVDQVMRTYVTPDHQVSLVIMPKPSSSIPKTVAGAGSEDVSYTPSPNEVLPAWAALALKEPLSPPQEANIVTNRLANGLRFTARRETTAPVVVVSGVIRTSWQLYEPKGKDGVGMVVRALLPWGTTTYDRKGYEKQLDDIAAEVTLSTTFNLVVQAQDFERGMQLLSDGMLHPAFPQAGFNVVKANILASVAAANKLPAEKADLAERFALYPPGDPRRRDIDEKTIAAISLADAKKYYQFAYRPDETSIAIVGDVSPQQARALVEKYFGSWKATGPQPTFQFPKIKQNPAKALTVTVKSATNTQSDVTLRQVISMHRSDDAYVPLLLANTMLSGEGTGSLLFRDLRTRHGYVYSVDSNVDVSQERTEFSISFACDPKDVNRAQAAALAIVKNMQTQPLPAVELQRAKALLLAQRVLPLDSYGGVAADMLSGVKDGYYTDGTDKYFWDALVATTPSQVQQAMKRIDTQHFIRVIVAP